MIAISKFLKIVFPSRIMFKYRKRVACARDSYTPILCIRSHRGYFIRPKTTGGGRRKRRKMEEHFKAFCGKHGRVLLQNSWLMQVPRYRTAYTAIRLAPVMVDMNLPLRETLDPLLFSFRISLPLVTSLSLCPVFFFFRSSFSRGRTWRVFRSSKFLSVHLSVRPPHATLISTLQICDAPRRRAKVH